jgi:N-acetylglucosaminyldiphosphoundecaprenol N-acetyl-beta-D-mannosaminyltransferase
MINNGKKNLLGVLVDAVDYDGAVASVVAAAKAGRPLAATALAVHGVMTGYADDDQRARLNQFDLILPDGQPVRWALNLLHDARLPDRVYGPELMLRLCHAGERERLAVYLYGSTPAVLDRLQQALRKRFPALSIAGAEPSKFRQLSPAEKGEVVARIRASGAQIVLVGLGCPRQEIWAYEYHEALGMPVVAVGAAFDFHSGMTKQAPRWMQDHGLEWCFRLKTEPRRLWRRYVVLNPWYIGLVFSQLLRFRHFSPGGPRSVAEVSHG